MGSMIGFAGLSHLGTVSSIATAARGFDVVAYDPDAMRIAALQKGQLHVHEPGLAELLGRHAKQLQFTAQPRDLAACGVVVLAIDIPTNSANQADVGSLDQLVERVLEAVGPECVLVILSQVPPGYTRALGHRLKATLDRKRIQLYYQVETLVFGRAIERALQPERFMVGCEDSVQPLPEVYLTLLKAFNCPILPMRYESAELAKIAINIVLAASISATNTLAEICEHVGADWAEIVPALKLDKRIGPFAYLSPGLGIAGGNLERDLEALRSLASAHGADGRVIDAFLANSNYRRDWVLRTLRAALAASGQGPIVAIWGLAYKPNTHSTKNSPALALIQAFNGIRMQTYDPQANVAGIGCPEVGQRASPLAACHDADILVIMTPWPQFAQVDLVQVRATMRGRILVDPYGCLDGEQAKRLGFWYFKLGTAAPERKKAA
jgi:UDPglucose 6-dehydrogenase